MFPITVSGIPSCHSSQKHSKLSLSFYHTSCPFHPGILDHSTSYHPSCYLPASTFIPVVNYCRNLLNGLLQLCFVFFSGHLHTIDRVFLLNHNSDVTPLLKHLKFHLGSMPMFTCGPTCSIWSGLLTPIVSDWLSPCSFFYNSLASMLFLEIDRHTHRFCNCSSTYPPVWFLTSFRSYSKGCIS